SEFKEYIHDYLALVLPKLKDNDDLLKNKKLISNGLVFYYLYFSELNDQKKVAESIKTLIKDEESLTLDQVKKRLDQLDARPVETAE
ncbi:spore germination protein, partial [Bacillus vallismortis]|nr:spore germination protein [Bacillus vallismortis]